MELKIYYSRINKQLQAGTHNDANKIKNRHTMSHLSTKCPELLQWLTKNNQNLEPSQIISHCKTFYS